MRKAKYLIVLLFTMASIEVMAQYDTHFSHYWALEPSFNPATVGKTNKINVAAAYSMSLTGFENSPKTMYAGGDLPFYFLNAYHGVGAELLSDDIGLFTHKSFALQYAYRRKAFGGMFSIGVRMAMLSEGFEGSKVDLETPDDPAFPTADVTGSSFDVGLGLYFSRDSWYVGVSGLHLNAPKIEIGEKQEFDVSSLYYFTAGYNIRLRNPFLSIQPSLLCQTDGVAYRVDAGGRLTYTNDKKMMYVGLSYSPANSVTLMLGGNFHGVCLGYSYEAYTSAISLGNGGHEIFIGYQTDINIGKKGKNMHKSVRLL